MHVETVVKLANFPFDVPWRHVESAEGVVVFSQRQLA